MSFSNLLDKLKTIRERGQWGRQQSLESVASAFESEFQELRQAISKQDHLNAAEEIGDLLILLGLYIVILSEKESRINEERVLDIAIKKLNNRYPILFPRNQLTFLDALGYNLDEEVALWEEGRQRESKLEYCFCSNPECKEYKKPFSTVLELITNRGRPYVRCATCGRKASLAQSCLFNKFRTPKLKILQTIADCVSGKDSACMPSYRSPSHSPVRRWLQEAAKNSAVVAEIMCLRHGLDKEKVTQYLEKYK